MLIVRNDPYEAPEGRLDRCCDDLDGDRRPTKEVARPTAYAVQGRVV